MFSGSWLREVLNRRVFRKFSIRKPLTAAAMKHTTTFTVLLLFLAFSLEARAQNNDAPILWPFDPIIGTAPMPVPASAPAPQIEADYAGIVKKQRNIKYSGRHSFSFDAGVGYRSGRYISDVGYEIVLDEPENIRNTAFGASYVFRILSRGNGTFEWAPGVGLRYIGSGRSGDGYSYGGESGDADVYGYERIHYLGVEWVPSWRIGRVILSLGIGAGYMQVRTMLSQPGEYITLRDQGIALGLNLGVECKLTGWLGVGIAVRSVYGYLEESLTVISDLYGLDQTSFMAGLRFYFGR